MGVFVSTVLAVVVTSAVVPLSGLPASPSRAPCGCPCPSSGSPDGASVSTAPPAEVPAEAVAPVRANAIGSNVPVSPPSTPTGDGADQWYGGPAVAADAASLALMLHGAISNDEGTLLLGLTGYVLGAPINHLVRGRPSAALGSFGLRLLATGLAAGVALEDVLVNHCDGDVTPCRGPNYAIAIDTVLVLGVMALDDALFARAPILATRHAERTVSPGLLVGPSTAFVSLGGRF
jgi:hypothetical protein